AGFVAGDVFLGDRTKGALFRVSETLRLPLGALGGKRIGALAALRPVRSGPFPGPGERDIQVGTEPHVAALALDLEPEHPGLRSGRCDPQIKPAAIVQHGRPLRLRNLNRRELSSARHRCPSLAVDGAGLEAPVPPLIPPPRARL